MSVKLRKRKLADGRTSLYLDLYELGCRKYEFLNIYTSPGALDNKEKLRQAERLRAQRELDQLAERLGIVSESRMKGSFNDFTINYLSNYPKRDIRMVKYALQKFDEYVQSRYDTALIKFQDLTPELVSGFKSYLLSTESGLKGETPQNYFSRFKRILKLVQDRNLIPRDPSTGITIRRSIEVHKDVLSHEEISLLAATPCGNEVVKRAFLFSCFTGVGYAEVMMLTLDNVKGNRFWYIRNKTKKKVSLPLHESARKLIVSDMDSMNGLLFPLPSSTAVNKCLGNWVRRAGITNRHITFYSARHSFATNLLLNGVNLKTVADCMGHTTIQHTLKYLNHVDELKDEAVLKLTGI